MANDITSIILHTIIGMNTGMGDVSVKEKKQSPSSLDKINPVISPPKKPPVIDIDFDKEVIEKRLSNPDLDPSDRSILKKYQDAVSISNLEKAQEIKNKAKEKLEELLNLEIRLYDGKVSLMEGWLSRRVLAFTLGIEALKMFSEEDYKQINIKVYKQFLAPGEKEVLDSFAIAKGKKKEEIKETILGQITYYNGAFSSAPWGSKTKIKLTQSMIAFRTMCITYGISEEEIGKIDLIDIFGLNEKDVKIAIVGKNRDITNIIDQ